LRERHGGTIGRAARVAGAAALVLRVAAPALADEWFEAYEKGLKALRQRQAVQAVEHFERAVKKQQEPGTNLLTYGTNRIERYHPYLRLAEAQLLAGKPEAAREALRRSEAFKKEPAEERSRLITAVETAIENAKKVVAATPAAVAPPTLASTVPPTPAPTTPPSLAPTAPPATLPVALPGALTPAPSPAPVPASEGTLELRTDPAGATVLVDGRLFGETPLEARLPAGDHRVTLRKDGSADQSFTIRIAAGPPTVVRRMLVATGVPAAAPATPAAPTAVATVAAAGSLEIHSEPAGASVYLDDEPVGVTDPATGRLVKTGLAPGAHRLRLSHTGREDVAQEVVVAATGTTSVRAALPAPSSSSSLPVAAAGGAGLLALGGLTFWALRRRAAGTHGETVALPAAGAPTPAPSTATPPRPRTGTVKLEPTPPSRRPTFVNPGTVPEPGAGDQIETRALSPGVAARDGGNWFGPYRLLEQLGKGGMASVVRAERDGEPCALKRPLSGFLDDPEFLERFLREAEIGRTLHHPNIIRIFERGDVDGVPYFTMELVEGETLQARIRRDGPLRPREAAKLVVQVAEALDYAHLKGVVHRDLKPSNIMILADGTVKVMDYGIARARRFEGLTVTGAFLGTPDYVAPETAEGKPTDARSDLYSLGIVFYEILTGKKPFVGETPFATLRKHCTEPPTPPSLLSPEVPKEAEAIILKLLCKNPDDRYPGAEELLIALRAYLNRAV
jgi:hypothetical protein